MKKAHISRGASRKSRARYDCPPELQELIDEANLVPQGIMTPDFEPERKIEIDRLRIESGEISPEFSSYAFLQKLIEHLRNLAPGFLEYLFGLAFQAAYPSGIAPEDYLNDSSFRKVYVHEYVRYCSRRGSLVCLVKKLEAEREQMRKVDVRRKEIYLLDIGTGVIRGDDHKLSATGLVALLGKFDDSRLRRCAVCKEQKIFWAARRDSKACSPKCLNILNVRKSRARSPEEKAANKAAREANAKYKKKKEALKK